MKNDFLNRVLNDLRNSLNDDKIDNLSSEMTTILKNELFINVSEENIRKHLNSPDFLSKIIGDLLVSSKKGLTIIDVFEKIEEIAKQELHKSIELHWYSKWDDFNDLGNFLTSPDSLDFVEMFIRIEEEFNIKLYEEEIFDFDYVGKTVQYIWLKLQQNRL